MLQINKTLHLPELKILSILMTYFAFYHQNTKIIQQPVVSLQVYNQEHRGNPFLSSTRLGTVLTAKMLQLSTVMYSCSYISWLQLAAEYVGFSQ